MKKIYFTIGVLAMLLTTSCRFNDEDQSIQVVVTDDTYVFEAKYPKGKTETVVNFIEERLEDDDFFPSNEGEKSGAVVLSDGKKFNIKSSPGLLEIDFKKHENSENNYRALVNLCTGLRDELK